MRCEDALNQLNARADGELRDGELLVDHDDAELAAHLADCSQCKAAADGLPIIDSELRRAFGPRREGAARLAERTVAMLRATAETPVPANVSPRTLPTHGWAWGQTLVGLAAGFLLAALVFQPWRPQAGEPDAAAPSSATAQLEAPSVAASAETAHPNTAPPNAVLPIFPVARLACASGPVEVRPINVLPTLLCPVKSPIDRDSVVCTGPSSRCEIALPGGNAVRLDCNSEVTLHKSEVLEVSRGRVSRSCEPGQKGFEVFSGGGKIVANDAAEIAVDCQPDGVRLIVVGGEVNVQTGVTSTRVDAGNQVRIVKGKLENGPEHCDPMLETAWVNSVLALNGGESRELDSRVQQLLAKVGAAKLSLLYEDELRRLGDDGVPPLLAYLASTQETPDTTQRVTAARIVADVAQLRWIASLIELLTDANAEVRFHAARCLERLTGRTQGLAAEAWQTKSSSERAEAHDAWVRWWAANRDRYPAVDRSGPPLPSPPF